MTSAERQREFRKRAKEQGLTQVTVWVPALQAADIAIVAKRLCENRDLEIGPLRNVATGRYEGRYK